MPVAKTINAWATLQNILLTAIARVSAFGKPASKCGYFAKCPTLNVGGKHHEKIEGYYQDYRSDDQVQKGPTKLLNKSLEN